MSDEKEEDGQEESKERPRLRKFAKKLFGDQEEGSDARDILGAVWETGDKAKSEVVRLVAREVRGYLEALELHKDVQSLLTNYSLEVNASFHLKPLVENESAEEKQSEAAPAKAQPMPIDEEHPEQEYSSESEHIVPLLNR